MLDRIRIPQGRLYEEKEYTRKSFRGHDESLILFLFNFVPVHTFKFYMLDSAVYKYLLTLPMPWVSILESLSPSFRDSGQRKTKKNYPRAK
jgi:hypothetical protein